MRKINSIISIIFIVLLFSISFLSKFQEKESTFVNNSSEIVIRADSPIHINGNGNFTEYGFPGNGSVANPLELKIILLME